MTRNLAITLVLLLDASAALAQEGTTAPDAGESSPAATDAAPVSAPPTLPSLAVKPASQQPPTVEQPAPPAAAAAIPLSQQQAPASLSAATAITPEPAAPFAFADFTWLNGNPRTTTSPLDTKLFTGEFRVDTSYIDDFNHPTDHTLSGTSESGRTDEFQVQQLGVGGDFHYANVQMRVMTQFGMFSTMTPRNDASSVKGQWDLSDAYRYISEAYGGYHFNVWHGINVQAGIFMSYVGLFSYYGFDNWAYQPSYVSSNTPWFFNGMRIQIFPTDKLKIEPWLVNGWQSYGKFNNRPGFGLQVLWRPTGWLSILGNQYALGTDTLGNPDRVRYHTDDSIQVKYLDTPASLISKGAFSVTVDLGCESGGGVSCFSNSPDSPQQGFAGFMVYNRLWFYRDLFGLTLGGGWMSNPGRYLVLMPPINGATAASGTPYFTENPGDQFHAWDSSGTLDFMPEQYVTFRLEFNHRHASVPYFAGHGGMTPPGESNTVSGSEVTTGAPGSLVAGWTPDLVQDENRINLALLVKF